MLDTLDLEVGRWVREVFGFSRVFLGFSWVFLGFSRVFLVFLGFSWVFLGFSCFPGVYAVSDLLKWLINCLKMIGGSNMDTLGSDLDA